MNGFKKRLLAFAVFFGLVAIGLGSVLAFRIYSKDNEIKTITRTEDQIKERLRIIRDAQTAYADVNGTYADSWAKLKDFLSNGKLYVIQTREIVHVNQATGIDSIELIRDTIGAPIAVRDSIFPISKYPLLNVSTIEKIPGSGKDFGLQVDKVEDVPVLVVWDVDPIDPKRRKEEPESPEEEPLRIGDLTRPTLQGNWEK